MATLQVSPIAYQSHVEIVAPGETVTAHGKVHFLRGEIEELYDRYRKDFCKQ